jgi:tetratricopeptide (TPR) repeat protein
MVGTIAVSSISETLALAFQHHQAGNLDVAEQLYQQIVQADPGQADAVHLLGTIAYRKGRFEQAVVLIGRALRLKPGAADYHTNIGLAYEASGQMDEAVRHYQQAAQIQPNSPEAHTFLGHAMLRQQRWERAMASYRHVLDVRPDWAPAHNGLGLAWEQQGQLDEAIRCFQQALRANPQFAEAHYNLGNVLRRQDKLEDAIHCYREALRLNPHLAEACNNLGATLVRQGKLADATEWYRQALRINADFADAHSGLGHALERQDRPEEAAQCYRQALRLNPSSAEAPLGLGCALERLDQLDEAIACYRQALELNPRLAEAHNNLATALQRQEKFDEALASFDQAVRLRPGYPAACWNRALLWLLQGNFERGWPEYEWRWSQPGVVRRSFRQPLWDGSPLGGRSILLYAEQGLGDTLQFIRFVSLVKQRGGKVVVECQPPLLRLLAGFSEIDQLVAAGSPLPPFDVQAPLCSLGRILGISLKNILAPVPYLKADAKLAERWRHELEPMEGFKIGIAWQGNPANPEHRQRSIPLACFEPLARVKGVQLISLQKGPGTEQLQTVVGRFPVLDLGGRLDEASGAFMDTAAVMQNLDLVISSDTAIGHLAGALGVPTWLALTKVPDWRWLLGRPDSPWYPKMRLFRQKRVGDWQGVFEEMAGELKRR